MKKAIKGHIIVYTIWLNGRSIDNIENHYPIDCYNVDGIREWTTNFKKIVKDYFKIIVKDSDNKDGDYTEAFKDYHICLYSIDVDIKEFEIMFGLDFDINNEDVQDCLPDYINYDFNVVAERIAKFKKTSQ